MTFKAYIARSFRLKLGIALGATVSIGLLWAGLGSMLMSDRRETVENQVQEESALVRAFNDVVASLVDRADAALRMAGQEYERLGSADLAEITRQFALPAGTRILLIDRTGKAVHSNGRIDSWHLAEQQYFRAHLGKTSDMLHIGKATAGDVAGLSFVQLSRRLNNHDGTFAGVAVLTLDASRLSLFHTEQRDRTALFCVLGLNGDVLACNRREEGSSAVVADMRGVSLQALAAGGQAGYTRIAGAGREPWHINYRRMTRYPLVVVAGVAEYAALTDFMARRRDLLLAGWVVTLLIAGAAAWLIAMAAARERAVGELAESRASLLAFMSSVPDIAWMKDRRGRFRAVNQSFLHCLNVSNSIIGQADVTAFDEETVERLRECEALAVSSEALARIETKLKRGEQERWYELIIGPAYAAQGEVVGTCGVARDITDRKAAEAAMMDANCTLRQKATQLTIVNRDLEAFSYAVSHNLRAPLQCISADVRSLRRSVVNRCDGAAAELVDKIEQGARRLMQLIDDLIVFSRAGRLAIAREIVPLDTLVYETVGEFVNDTVGRHVAWQVSPLPIVHGDPALLRLAFRNIISNALKYTSTRDTARIKIDTAKFAGEYCTVCVRDNGIGFDMADADRLFEAFEPAQSTRAEERSGIGLAIVRRAVERHGGRVWAVGEPNVGATFYLTLPLRHASA